jgi:hypothetical protein
MPSGSQEDIDKQLEDWAKENDYEFSKGPDGVLADQTIQSYRDYLVAKNTVENAPTVMANAEDAYLRKRYGASYDVKRKQAYVKQATEIAKPYSREHNLRVEKANKAFTMYKTVAKFASQSVNDYAQSVALHIAAMREANSSVEFQTTTQRKTFYLNQERSTIESWDTALTLLIVSVALIFGYQFIFVQRLFKNLWIWFILLLLFLASFLLPFVVNWIVHIPPAVNVYSSWAQTVPSEWHGNDDF